MNDAGSKQAGSKPAEPRPDGRQRPTRAHLVRSATGLYRRHGVVGTGVAQICEKAGVTKGVFSHHFPGGKDDLTVAVIEANSAQVRSGFVDLVTAGRPPAAVVTSLFSGYATMMRSRGNDFGCPIAASVVDVSASSPGVREATRAAFASWRHDLEPLLGAALAEVVVATLEGAILIARAEGDPEVMRRTGRRLAELVEPSAGADRAVGS